ncbi:MAG: tetratricopeptide repeat protein [Acidobacteriota bacterium]
MLERKAALSSKLANELVNSETAVSFLDAHRGVVSWRSFAALKREVDRLVHSDLNAASKLADRVEQLAKLTKDPASVAFAAASRARVLHLLGRHADANVFYERAVKALRKSRLSEEAAIVRKQQVDALTHMGRYRDALRAAQESRRVLAPRDSVQLAQLEANVGNIYYLLGRYKKALEHYDRAREVLAVRGDRKMLALVDTSRRLQVSVAQWRQSSGCEAGSPPISSKQPF